METLIFDMHCHSFYFVVSEQVSLEIDIGEIDVNYLTFRFFLVPHMSRRGGFINFLLLP